MRKILLTGFEPYGPWPSNPAASVVAALHGRSIEGALVHGVTLPVVLEHLNERIDQALAATQPSMVLSLGLHPGAATLRLERVGLNVADFAQPDNAGAVADDASLVAHGALALRATLPLRAIRARHLQCGLPSVISNSAGTYLCNATLYQFLTRTGEMAPISPCGFIHLPFEPAQVALLLERAADGASGGGPGQETIASMHLDSMIAGVEIAIRTTMAQAAR